VGSLRKRTSSLERARRSLRRRSTTAAKIGVVKTRTLLILAAVTGLLIVAAGAIQIMLAR
jgi:hypothetical protein